MSCDNHPSPNSIKPGSDNPTKLISMLHHDILYEIFLWNTNIFSTMTCIDTTRRTSQVCRAWRSFILNSPTLWGHLIALPVLNQKTDYWRDEVLRRSGNSLLWISGEVSGTKSNIRPGTSFFYAILNTHWERIQHLRIHIFDEPMEEHLWSPLQRPAPNLRSCSLSPYELNPELLFSASESPLKPLFSDHAPSLYHFAAEGFFLSLSAPWISQLRVLHLSSPFPISEVLHALCSTPLLQSLSIRGLWTAELHPTSTSLPSVDLPHLTELHLTKTRLGLLANFLTHIRHADDCTFEYGGVVGSSMALAEWDLKVSSQTLSRAIQRCLLTHTVTSIGLSLIPNAFWFWDCAFYTALRIFIASEGLGDFPPDSYHLFPSFLSNCDFSTVTKLYLDLTPLPPASPTAYFPFFSLFSFVTDLSADEKTLQTIIDTPPNENEISGSVVFPHIHRLTLSFTEEPRRDPGPILRFLRWRRENGTPIHTVDLGLLDDWIEERDINMSLEEIKGLRVVWRDECDNEFEYICGSGRPDALFVGACCDA